MCYNKDIITLVKSSPKWSSNMKMRVKEKLKMGSI